MSRKDVIKGNLRGKGGQRGQRKRGRGNQPLTSVTEPLTLKQARHQAKVSARAETQPLISAIKGEREGSRQREKEIGQWFGGLTDQANQAAQATDASYAQANNALQAHAAAGAAAAQGMQGQIAGQNAQMASLTGADSALFAPIAAEQAGAAGQRQVTNQALAAPVAQAGASQAGFLRNTALSAAREGIQQRGKESKRRQQIKQDLAEARSARGGKAVDKFNEIVNNERDFMIQNRAFPLEKKQASEEARENQRKAGNEEQEGAFDRSAKQRELELRERELNQEGKRARNEGKGGLTPSERRSRKAAWNNARSAAQTLFESKEWPSWAALTRAVQKEGEVSPAMARRAVEKIRRRVEGPPGGLGPPEGHDH